MQKPSEKINEILVATCNCLKAKQGECVTAAIIKYLDYEHELQQQKWEELEKKYVRKTFLD